MEYIGHRPAFHELACVHHRHAGGDPSYHAEIVADIDHRGVHAPLDLFEQIEDDRFCGCIQIGRRLIQNH